jgi:murein DD-endopeptidase MepM/ murein hydrolase activator NlpD
MKNLTVAIFILLVFSGCSAAAPESQIPEFPAATEYIPTQTAIPLPTETPIPPTPTPDYIDLICSPLEGESLAELPEIITQPYKTPRAANDDGHQGVDFAFYRHKDFVGIEGMPVTAALEGEVVTILYDKYPYGYAVIIETPLDSLDPAILTALSLPEIQPTIAPDPRVNCPPDGKLTFTLSDTRRSLYVLYGHLKDIPDVAVGDQIACGQKIGLVGNTGYSSNPHLHFETRVGPSGARFESMAYYTVQSTEAERYNYCIWRVSNQFQLFDPMILLSIQD